MRIFLDYETFSPVPITDGVRRYAAKAEILLAAVYDASGSLVLQYDVYDPHSHVNQLRHVLLAADESHAFNAPFEREITRACLGLDIPTDRWHCTMAFAYSRGFAGGLDMVGAALGIPSDQQKLVSGGRLIQRFCKPRTPTASNPRDRFVPEDDPVRWEQFREYNRMDVVAELAVHNALADFPEEPFERNTWLWDQEVNDTGLPIDMPLVQNAIRYDEMHRGRMLDQLRQITGLDNPNSRDQLLGWLRDEGLPDLPDLRAETVSRVLKEPQENSAIADVLELRLALAKTSVKKYEALRRAESSGRLYGSIQYCGASRTGRFAGRIFQPQNLPRPTIPDVDTAAELLSEENFDLLDLVYGDPMAVLSSCVRGAIAAPKGFELVVSDLSSIESRVLGWISQCKRIRETFAAGKDTYKVFASGWFGVPYDQVTPAQRNQSKPPTLGCGYRLGAKGLVKYADSMGITLTDAEAKDAVRTFRTDYPEIPIFWDAMDESLYSAVMHKETVVSYGLVFRVEGDFLTIRLPSGRKLYYHHPRFEDHQTPWGEMRATFSYMGLNQYTRKWERLFSHSGKITENIVQAIARDVLVYGLRLAGKRGLCVIGHVHDEGLGLSQEQHAESDLFILDQCLGTTPPWAPGLSLSAKGYYGKRYRKG